MSAPERVLFLSGGGPRQSPALVNILPSRCALRDLCETRHVLSPKIPDPKRDPLWFPYSASGYKWHMRLLRTLNDAGKTIIMVTHENDIAAWARRVVRMRDGHIESDVRNDQAVAQEAGAGNQRSAITGQESGIASQVAIRA